LQEDAYCKNCGAIFSDGLSCSVHGSIPAAGVCVICEKPFCSDCGGEENRVFVCDTHSKYEIVEGMGRVFGCTDNVQAQYVTTVLEQGGFHPFLYSRRFNPGADLVAVGGVMRNFGGYPIVELKVLVPFAEVLKAEGALSALQL
jgi:hypothetical protein